jgi:hypothetical protein
MKRIHGFKLWIILIVIEQCKAAPYSLSLTPASDTIQAGTTITITATVKDSLGNELSNYESTVQWILNYPPFDGSTLLGATIGNHVIFTATKAYHSDTIKALLLIEPMFSYIRKSVITIHPNRPYQVYIEKDSIPASLWSAVSPDTVRLVAYDSTLRLYAIERDTFGNYIRMAVNPSWAPLRNGIISVSSPLGKKGEANISAIDSGICPLVVRDSTLAADTVYIYVTNPPTVITQFPIGIGKGNTNNVRELYDLKGRKLCRSPNYGISGAYIVKVGYICNKRVRIAGSRELNFFR